jgi:UDP-N-acetyl-D-mannosaminuronate dehydrogenase
MVQSQSTSSDDLDAISQDVQQLSEPDVSVDSIPTPLSGDSLNDLNGLDQQEQDMQQVLESLK